MKIKIDVDLSNESQIAALNTLLRAVGGHHEALPPWPDSYPHLLRGEAKSYQMETPPEAFVKEEVGDLHAPKKKRRTKAEIEADKEEEAPEEQEEAPSITLSDLRKSLGAFINTGGDKAREAAFAKLKEFGVSNLSSLPESKYDELATFLAPL
jgi:hypothetical protein